jgi:hypothetical protein
MIFTASLQGKLRRNGFVKHIVKRKTGNIPLIQTRSLLNEPYGENIAGKQRREFE